MVESGYPVNPFEEAFIATRFEDAIRGGTVSSPERMTVEYVPVRQETSTSPIHRDNTPPQLPGGAVHLGSPVSQRSADSPLVEYHQLFSTPVDNPSIPYVHYRLVRLTLPRTNFKIQISFPAASRDRVGYCVEALNAFFSPKPDQANYQSWTRDIGMFVGSLSLYCNDPSYSFAPQTTTSSFIRVHTLTDFKLLFGPFELLSTYLSAPFQALCVGDVQSNAIVAGSIRVAVKRSVSQSGIENLKMYFQFF